MIEKPVYILKHKDKVYNCEFWRYGKPENYGSKVRRSVVKPELKYYSEKLIDSMDMNDYEELMSVGNKYYYILKEYREFKEKLDHHSNYIHDRLERIKLFQLYPYKKTPESNWDGKLSIHYLLDFPFITPAMPLPEPLPGFNWYFIEEYGSHSRAGWLEVDNRRLLINRYVQQYTRYVENPS